MGEGNTGNGGTNTAVNGKCPEGFVHVFGPLCVEQTRLAKLEEGFPEAPEIKPTTPECEAALAAYKYVIDIIEAAIEVPLKIKRMISDLVEMPFDAAYDVAKIALGAFDDLYKLIDELLGGAGGLVNDLKQCLEDILRCPFLVDTPIGKTAAAILDAIDSGASYLNLIFVLKNLLLSAASQYINMAKDIPLSKLNDLENLYKEMLRKAGVEELLKQARDLEKCIAALCDMIEVADRIPEDVETIMEKIGAIWDSGGAEIKEKLEIIFEYRVNKVYERVVKLADDLYVIRLAGKG